MNAAAVIFSAVFVVISLAVLLVIIFGRHNPLSTHKFKKYFASSAGVYLSGSVLILCLTIFLKGLPTIFAVISQLTIMFVFFFTLGLLYRMSRQIDDIMEAIAQGKARSAEQVAKEDAEYEGRFKDDNIDSNEDNKDN